MTADVIRGLIESEEFRRSTSIQLIASENISSRDVLMASGSLLSWKTGEGQPGRRYHTGCEVIDEIEKLAVRGACRAFKAGAAWVQPLSASLANLECYLAIQRLVGSGSGGLRVMALGLDTGGHLSHGTRPHISRQMFSALEEIQLDPLTLQIDLESLRHQASKFKPHIIVSGASSYPRRFPFEEIGAIAQDLGAYHIADISHISGLVSAGVHPSPVPHSHLVTLSTYKAGGPRGGLILAGNLATETLIEKIGIAVFPGVQGTADFGNIAAKAVLFDEMITEEYIASQHQIVANAAHLAKHLGNSGFGLVTGGTDTHMVLIETLSSKGITGDQAEGFLADAGIFANRNLIPFDPLPASKTSGLRLGTNTVTRQGMKEDQVTQICDFISRAVEQPNHASLRRDVTEFATQFSTYPLEK